jgi:hypothetical protein
MLRAEFNKILGPGGVFLAARATRRQEPHPHSITCKEAMHGKITSIIC